MARWAVFTEVAAGTLFFCELFADFSVRKPLRTTFNYLIFVSRVRAEMLTVTITPNIYTIIILKDVCRS